MSEFIEIPDSEDNPSYLRKSLVAAFAEDDGKLVIALGVQGSDPVVTDKLTVAEFKEMMDDE